MVVVRLLLGALAFIVAVAFAGEAGRCFSVAKENSKWKDAKGTVTFGVLGFVCIALALGMAIVGLLIVEAI